MKLIIQILLLLNLFLSCTTLPAPGTNLSQQQINNAAIGTSRQDLITSLGDPFHTERYPDSSSIDYYLNDYTSGNLIYCRNIAFVFGSDQLLIDKKFTAEPSDTKKRCNMYSEHFRVQSANFSNFANSANQSIDEYYGTEPSDGKSCTGNYSCGEGYVCAKSKTGVGLSYEGKCVKIMYFED